VNACSTQTHDGESLRPNWTDFHFVDPDKVTCF